jgi:anthranilate phosphoribosyltransferase
MMQNSMQKKMIEIFKGQDNDYSKAVCLNAAAGLIVAEKFTEFSEAYTVARKYILSGNTFQTFKKNSKCLKIY